ncbi:unnamed protein product [Timema podura]|uniref:Amino acid transporter transmembrane domain-containing protein n=1 Tax=Timema podura TaxID=61482 RepID=A0ABN7NVU7_TIMPD|nr:unnamed protein product [Timema podura]
MDQGKHKGNMKNVAQLFLKTRATCWQTMFPGKCFLVRTRPYTNGGPRVHEDRWARRRDMIKSCNVHYGTVVRGCLLIHTDWPATSYYLFELYAFLDKPITPDRASNPNLPIIGSPAYFKSDPELITHSTLFCYSFSVWNTIMGSSLLVMPWGLEKAGLLTGMFLNVTMGGLCLYTTYRILQVHQLHGTNNPDGEVADLCKILLGRSAEMVTKVISLVVLLGANIVYWVLMSNFLYYSVDYVHDDSLDLASMFLHFLIHRISIGVELSFCSMY